MPEWMIAFNILAACLWSFQLVFAFLYFRQRNSCLTIKRPSLSVVIPAFNETPDAIQRVVDSVVAQQHVNVEIYVIDDGSQVPIQLDSHPDVSLLRLPQNVGKRHAQIRGIRQAKYDWIVTVDSDTVLEPNALFCLYKEAVRNNFDAVTGTVYLSNARQNFLTKIVACLYWYGFAQERAYQAYFGAVNCCSGALALYRKSTFLKVADDYLTQTFLGKQIVAGDDRHITSLFAKQQKKIGYCFSAKAYTFSPSELRPFCRQQLRWSRSFVPCFFFVFKQPWNFSLTFILCLTGTVFRYAYSSVLYFSMIRFFIYQQALVVLVILGTISVISTIKALIGWLYTRELKFINMLPLGMFCLLFLTPLYLYGMFTSTATGWSTRKK